MPDPDAPLAQPVPLARIPFTPRAEAGIRSYPYLTAGWAWVR